MKLNQFWQARSVEKMLCAQRSTHRLLKSAQLRENIVSETMGFKEN
jgi:hypothetical protein